MQPRVKPRVLVVVTHEYKSGDVAKNVDLRNMDVFQLCACAQFARDHIWVTCKLLAELFGRRMLSEEEAIAIC